MTTTGASQDAEELESRDVTSASKEGTPGDRKSNNNCYYNDRNFSDRAYWQVFYKHPIAYVNCMR